MRGVVSYRRFVLWLYLKPHVISRKCNGVSQLTFWLGEFGDDQLATHLAP